MKTEVLVGGAFTIQRGFLTFYPTKEWIREFLPKSQKKFIVKGNDLEHSVTEVNKYFDRGDFCSHHGAAEPRSHTKASTQRRTGQKEPVKMFMNLGYRAFSQVEKNVKPKWTG